METALVTAFIAAGAAVVAAIVSWFGALQNRRSHDRDHAWGRFAWALGCRPHTVEYDISKTVLEELARISWWSRSDRAMARRVRNRLIADEQHETRPGAQS